MSSWYNVKVKFTKEFQDGTLKRVTEPYLVSAGSFTEAEARIYEEVGEFIRGEFIVSSIARMEVADIFHYDDCDQWFLCKVSYTTEDDNGKEKVVVNSFLVTAKNPKEASERVEYSLKGLMSTFKISSIAESPLVEILPAKEEELVKGKSKTKKLGIGNPDLD